MMVSNLFKIFKLRKEERWLAAVAFDGVYIFQCIANGKSLENVHSRRFGRVLFLVYTVVQYVGI